MSKKSFFIEIKLLQSFSKEFFELIPEQRKLINRLMDEGKIISYSLALDRTRLWIIADGRNEETVLEMLASFPLIRFMKPEIHELAFHDNVHSGFPHLSLN